MTQACSFSRERSGMVSVEVKRYLPWPNPMWIKREKTIYHHGSCIGANPCYGTARTLKSVVNALLNNTDTDTFSMAYLCKKRLHPPYSSQTTRAGPAERRHRLRFQVRKSHQMKGERFCQDRGKAAVPLCWCFPFTKRLSSSPKWFSFSNTPQLYAQKATWEKSKEAEMKN